MKKICKAIISLAIVCSILSGCAGTDTKKKDSATTSNDTTDVTTTVATTTASTTKVAESTTEKANTSSAQYKFMLGKNESSLKSMKVGDKIGLWTLKELKIGESSTAESPWIEATFQGKVTVNGTVTQFQIEGGEPNGNLAFTAEDIKDLPVASGDNRVKYAEVMTSFNDLKGQLKVNSTDCNCKVAATVTEWKVRFKPMGGTDQIKIEKVTLR